MVNFMFHVRCFWPLPGGLLTRAAGPMHKRNFQLKTGACLNDNNYSILTFEVKLEKGNIFLFLPEPDELDKVLGTNKWIVRAATSQLYAQNSATQIDIVVPDGRLGQGCTEGCGGGKLEW